VPARRSACLRPSGYAQAGVTARRRGNLYLPHPLYPPLLARLSAGEGEEKKEGLSPLLNTPNKYVDIRY